MQNAVVLFIRILLATILVYWGIWQGYFQQDEWNGFAKIIASQTYGYWSLIRFSGNHFTPLTTFFITAFYQVFGLKHQWYALYSIVLHAANSFLVFFLAHKMLKNKSAALLATTLFLVAYTPRQAVTWYAASLSYLPSTFFALLSLFLFEQFLIKKTWILWVWTLILTCIAAGFRENAVFLLAYFPIRAFLVQHARRTSVLFSSLLTAGVYLSLRFVPLLFQSPLTTVAPHTERFHLGDIVNQAFTFLVFYLPRLTMPLPVPLSLADLLLGPSAGLARERILALFYIGIWIGIIGTGKLLAARVLKHKEPRTIAWSLVCFLLLSILPFSLFPPPLIMESRHYYLSSVGSSILLGYIIAMLLTRLSQRRKYVLLILVVIYIVINVHAVQSRMQTLFSMSRTRLNIVEAIESSYPTLPKKTMFLAMGDPLPFQSGVGQMLMVLFHTRQNYAPLLQIYFLGGIADQGYKEDGGVGFGYFTRVDLLLAAYCQHELKPEHVFAFSWNGKTDELTDTSQGVRRVLLCPQPKE